MIIPINASMIESIIKFTHIFNNTRIASKPRVVKVFPKSDMAIMSGMVHTENKSLWS